MFKIKKHYLKQELKNNNFVYKAIILFVLLLHRLNIENLWIATPLSEARNDESRHTNFRYFIAILTIGIIAPIPSFAEVFRPIQIMLPGNINGDLITFTEDQKAESSEAFKLPYVIKAFLKERNKTSFIFGIGNDSNAFKAFSYLNKGKAERELIDKCEPMAKALSPNDLEVFNDSYLNYEIKQRVFTNIEAYENNEIFYRYFLTTVNNQKVYFFNFISPEYCSMLPLERWSQVRIDNPARAIRKINPTFTKRDISLSVVYGDKSTVDEITDEFKRLDGIHFIVNVPLNGESPLFPTTHLEDGNRNVFRFSVESGTKVLPILNIIPKNYGYPRTTLRMIPLKKYSERAVKDDFKRVWQEVRQEFHKPLKVIPATNRATTSANLVSLQAHAEMIKYATNTEIAFLKLPNQIAFRESVMTVGDAITRFPNDRIIKFRATETQIKNMFISMLDDSSIKEFGFAGCNFLVLGNQYWDFSVNRKSIDKDRLYTISTTQSTAKEFAVRNLMKKSFVEAYDGLTLWTVWRDNLRSFPANEDKLFD